MFKSLVIDSIEKALKFSGNHYNLDDVLEQLYEDKAQLWIGYGMKRENKTIKVV